MSLHKKYEIRWKNFRGFEDTGWIKLKPLTILLGSNNSGKTSVIAPLLMMNQTIQSRDWVTPLVTNGDHVNLGGYTDFIKNHNTSNELFLGFKHHTHKPIADLGEVGDYSPGTVELKFGFDKKTMKYF